MGVHGGALTTVREEVAVAREGNVM